jgi:molybdopterin molybdotransferase
MISIEQAFQLLNQSIVALPVESTCLANAVGYVLAADVNADVDSPPHHKSVMDGFAVRSEDVASGIKRLEVVETIVAGDWPSRALQSGQAAKIMTGAPIPEGADAVVMVEQTECDDSGGQPWVTLKVESVPAEKHILRCGVNFQKGQSVFTQGHVIRPSDIGLLAEVGAHVIATGGKPTVAVLPTGNELVDCASIPARGQIRNSNGPMLISMARGLGLEVTDLGVGRDDSTELRERISHGLDHDLLILSGGVSAGTMDLVPGILHELGVQEVFHKVFVKPGKPIWFGVLNRDGNRTYVFGLPGNPVSSLVGFQLFVRAAVRKLRGARIDEFRSMFGELSLPHETRGDRPTYWPGKRAPDETAIRKFQPLVWRGSSDLLALGEAEGLIFFPADSNHHPAGELVRFLPFD